MKCPLCLGRGQAQLYPKTKSGRIVRCVHCGFVYADPRAPYIDHSFYPDADSAYKANTAEILKHFKNTVGITKGKLLDVGCYDGTFAAAAREFGYNVEAIEPNAKAAKDCTARHKIHVYVGKFEEIVLDYYQYDVISFVSVFQYFEKPKMAAQKAYNLLKPNGAIVIEVPNFACTARRLIGSRWHKFEPEDFYFYEPETLRMLLQEAGFTIMMNQAIGRTFSLDYFANDLSKHYNRAVGRLLSIGGKAFNINDVLFSIKIGDNLLCIAQKPDSNTIANRIGA